MKKNIKLTLALGLIGATSAHAANIAITASNPITSEVVVGAGDSWEQNDGYQDFTVNAGGFLNQTTNSSGRFRIAVSTSGSLTINGGSVNIETSNTILLGNGSSSRTALIDLVSGSLNIDGWDEFYLGRQNSTGILRIQGGVATIGSSSTTPGEGIIFDALAGNGSIDFTTANSGTLTVAGADKAYYEGLYAGTDLTFNSANTVAFDEQFSVTGSTITAIPEPATLGLIAAFGGGLLFIRRRFRS